MKKDISIITACALLWTAVANAQFGRGGAEWMTQGGDAQRSHWIPADLRISTDSLRKPGFQFLWKLKLNNESVQLNSLTPAVLLDRYIGYRGFRSLAFLGGSSNMIYAIDTDLSRIEWQRRLSTTAPPSGSITCPGGLTANIARATSATYPLTTAVGGGLGGRGAGARSAVGEPDQGAVTIPAALRAIASAPPRAPAAPRPPGVRPAAVIYSIAGDGTLHTMYLSNGVEPEPPLEFLPANANAQGLIVLGGIAYAITRGCNGAASAVWALDLGTKQVAKWQPATGSLAGAVGPAFGPDGAVYATTTAGELVELDRKTLGLTGRYVVAGQEFTSSPVVFPFRGKTLIAAATKDGRIHLLERAALMSNNQTPSASRAFSDAGNFAPGALASWQAVDGTRWILAAAAAVPASSSGFSVTNGKISNGAIAAWKVVDRNGSFALEAGWVSRDLVSPLTPIVVNGVVFAVSSGEVRTEDPKLSLAQRVQRSAPAVVYALDGTNGRVIWNSGKTITSFVHSGGLSAGAGQIYLEAYDQSVYVFGFPMEH